MGEFTFAGEQQNATAWPQSLLALDTFESHVATGSTREEATTVDFTMEINRVDGAKLGILTRGHELQPFGVPALEIVSVKEGLVMNWNREHPDKQAQVGDLILEINGIGKDVLQMYDAFVNHSRLALRIHRISSV